MPANTERPGSGANVKEPARIETDGASPLGVSLPPNATDAAREVRDVAEFARSSLAEGFAVIHGERGASADLTAEREKMFLADGGKAALAPLEAKIREQEKRGEKIQETETTLRDVTILEKVATDRPEATPREEEIIRERLREMPEPDREQAVIRMIEAGNPWWLRAVRRDPEAGISEPILNDARMARVVEAFSRKHRPDGWAKLDRLRKEHEEVSAALWPIRYSLRKHFGVEV